jgi:hypothetical protein
MAVAIMEAISSVKSEERMPKEALLRYLNSLWTLQDLMVLFDRKELTIHLWIKNESLPVVRIPGDKRDSIRFDRDDVLRWARTKKKRIFLMPVTRAAAG